MLQGNPQPVGPRRLKESRASEPLSTFRQPLYNSNFFGQLGAKRSQQNNWDSDQMSQHLERQLKRSRSNEQMPIFQQTSPELRATKVSESTVDHSRQKSPRRVSKMVEHVSYELLTPRLTEYNQKEKRLKNRYASDSKIRPRKSVPFAIKDFRFLKRLGKGRFGRVFLAQHIYSGFICALKVIESTSASKDRNLDQLCNQIKIQSYISSQYCAKLYGCFADPQIVCLVMEYCGDESLHALMKRKGKIDQIEAVPLLRQLSKGIAYIHESGIVHRDIKPQNVVIVWNTAKIIDFGWAADASSQHETFCGTPLYISPELLSGQPYDYKVDLWALGLIAYEMLFGEFPFQIKNKSELRKIVEDQIEYPKTLSVNAVDFLRRLLNREPTERLRAQDLQKHSFLYRSQMQRMNSLLSFESQMS